MLDARPCPPSPGHPRPGEVAARASQPSELLLFGKGRADRALAERVHGTPYSTSPVGAAVCACAQASTWTACTCRTATAATVTTVLGIPPHYSRARRAKSTHRLGLAWPGLACLDRRAGGRGT